MITLYILSCKYDNISAYKNNTIIEANLNKHGKEKLLMSSIGIFLKCNAALLFFKRLKPFLFTIIWYKF